MSPDATSMTFPSPSFQSCPARGSKLPSNSSQISAVFTSKFPGHRHGQASHTSEAKQGTRVSDAAPNSLKTGCSTQESKTLDLGGINPFMPKNQSQAPCSGIFFLCSHLSLGDRCRCYFSGICHFPNATLVNSWMTVLPNHSLVNKACLPASILFQQWHIGSLPVSHQGWTLGAFSSSKDSFITPKSKSSWNWNWMSAVQENYISELC